MQSAQSFQLIEVEYTKYNPMYKRLAKVFCDLDLDLQIQCTIQYMYVKIKIKYVAHLQ